MDSPAFLSPTNDPDAAEHECRDEREASEHDRVVPDSHIRRRTGMPLHSALEDAFGKLRQPRDNLAVGIDDRGHAGIGRAQHRASGLERAHARYLQVLGGSERVAEQATFETFTSRLASGNWRMISSPKASSSRCSARRAVRRARAVLDLPYPERNPRGEWQMFSRPSPKPAGTKLTEGTRCDLSTRCEGDAPTLITLLKIAVRRGRGGHADQNVGANRSAAIRSMSPR